MVDKMKLLVRFEDGKVFGVLRQDREGENPSERYFNFEARGWCRAGASALKGDSAFEIELDEASLKLVATQLLRSGIYQMANRPPLGDVSASEHEAMKGQFCDMGREHASNMARAQSDISRLINIAEKLAENLN